MENWSAYVMKGGLFLILLAAACIDSQQSITTSVQNGHTTTKTIATFGSYIKGTSLASEELSKTTQDFITEQENGKTSQQTHVASRKPVSLPMENTEKASESPAKTENILVSTNSTTSISISLISDSSLASTTANDLPVQIKTDYTSLSTTRSHTETLTLTLPTQSALVTADELVSTDERSSAEAATVFPTLTFKNSTSASQELTFSKETIESSGSSSTVQESPSPTADLDTATSNQKRLSTLSVTSSPHENPFFTGPSALTPTTDYFRSKGTTDHTASVDPLQLQTSDTESTMASLVTHSDTNSAQTSSTTRLVTQGPPTKLPATEQFSTRIFTENHSTTNEKDTTLETAETHTSAFDTTGSNTQNVRDVATLETTQTTSGGSQRVTISTQIGTSQSYETLPTQSAVEKLDSAKTQSTIITTSKGFRSTQVTEEQHKSPTTELLIAATSPIEIQSMIAVPQTVQTTVTYPAPFSVTTETPITIKLTTLATTKNQAAISSDTFVQQSTTLKPTTVMTQQSSIFVSPSVNQNTKSSKPLSSTILLQQSVTETQQLHSTTHVVSLLSTTMKSTIKESTTMVVSSSSEKKSQTTDLLFSETPSATQLTTLVTERIPTISSSSEVPQPDTTEKSIIIASTTMSVSSSSERKSQTTDIKSTETSSATQLTTSVTDGNVTASNSSELLQQLTTTMKSTIKASTTMVVSSSSEKKSQTTDLPFSETPSATQLTTLVTERIPTISNSSEVSQQLTTTMKSTIKASRTMTESTSLVEKSQSSNIKSTEPPTATQRISSITAGNLTSVSSEIMQAPVTTTKSTNTALMVKQKSTYFTPLSDQITTTSSPNIASTIQPSAPPQSSSVLITFASAAQETLSTRNVLSTIGQPSSKAQPTIQLTSLVHSGTVQHTTGSAAKTTSKKDTNKSSAIIPLQNTSVPISHTERTSHTTDFDTTEMYKKLILTTVSAKGLTVTKPANDGNQPVTVGSTEKARTTNRGTQSLTCEMPSTDQKDTTSTLQTSSSVTVESPQRLSTSNTLSTKSLASNSIKISTSFFQLIPTKSATKTTTASTVTKQVTNNAFFTTAVQNTSTQFSPNATVQTPDQKATETYTEIQPHSQLGEGFTSTQTTSLASSQRTTIVPEVSPSEITTAKKQSVAEEHDAIASSTKKQQTFAKHATDTTTPSGSEFVSRIRGFTIPTTLSMETTATQSFAPTVNVHTSANSTATNKEISISAGTVTAPIAALTGAASVQTTTQTISPLTTHTTATQTTTIGTPRFLEPTNPGNNLDTKNIASLSRSPLVTNTMQNSGFKDSSVSPSQRETMTVSSQGPFTEASSKSAKTEILTTVELASPAPMSINPDKTLVTFSKGTTQYATQEGKTNSPTSTQMSSSVSKDTQTTTITAPVLPLVSGLSSAATTSNTSPMTGYSPVSHKRTSTPPETTGLQKTENTDALSKPTIGSSISPSILLNDSKTAPNTTLGVSLSSSKSTDGTLPSNPSSLRPSSTEAASPMEITTSMKMVSQTIAAGDFSGPTSQRTVSANPSSNASVSSSAQSNTTQKQPGASSPAPRDSVVFFKLRKIAVVTRLVFEHPTFVRTTFRAANATD